jgi:hypothetical protein
MAVVKKKFAWCAKTISGWSCFVRHQGEGHSDHLVFVGDEDAARNATDAINVAFDAATTPAPGEPKCKHEAWEESRDGRSGKCADCGEYLPLLDTAPGEGKSDTVLHDPEKCPARKEGDVCICGKKAPGEPKEGMAFARVEKDWIDEGAGYELALVVGDEMLTSGPDDEIEREGMQREADIINGAVESAVKEIKAERDALLQQAKFDRHTIEEGNVIIDELKKERDGWKEKAEANFNCGIFIGKERDALKKERDGAVQVLRQIDKEFWFDPSEPGRGCCGFCEANLHPDFMGKHGCCDGKLCEIQVVHDFLALIGKEGKP